ncbi:MAG: gamma-glutamylcyclotransferase family protein [Acidobacteriaceae bacterium]
MDEATELASMFTVRDYFEMRESLYKADSSDEWKKVLNAFRRRIRERFLRPINELAKNDKREGDKIVPGFAMMTLDCLLIDTIQSFREGRGSTVELSPARSFKNFLGAEAFSEFTANDAGDFFNSVRNGLFHNGETRGGWRIRRDYTALLTKCGDARIINRRVFHSRVVLEFRRLCRDLKSPNTELRKFFLRRMDALCGRTVEPLYYRYFAYGSNLLEEELKRDVTDAEFQGRAFLPGYRLAFAKHACSRNGDAATIVEDKTSMVWGAIYRINEESRENLRRREQGYKEVSGLSVFKEGSGALNQVEAFTFIAENLCSKRCGPSTEYRQLVIDGAKSRCLPEEYVSYVSTL